LPDWTYPSYQFGGRLRDMEARNPFPVTPRTQVHRRPARASYDRAAAYSILDEALFASVGFVDDGHPLVIPMAFARLDDRVILHGAPASRLMKLLAGGAPVCVTVTIVDGLVLARSAMHHSLNYRSVVILGVPSELTDDGDKRAALSRLTDHVLPGRSAATRPPDEGELRATRVVAVPLDEVSVKRREGGPLDDAADLDLPHWAGVVPIVSRTLARVPDAERAPRGPEPAGLDAYDRAAFARQNGGRP
jgi:nitroimidazol reductase NimA-like FMN-containing flavoprotein (pyridoxamine 5'-phosphate oxidase superfamily)